MRGFLLRLEFEPAKGKESLRRVVRSENLLKLKEEEKRREDESVPRATSGSWARERGAGRWRRETWRIPSWVVDREVGK